MRQHVTDLEEKFRENEESINRARKQLDEEYTHRRKKMETEIREAKARLPLAKQDAKDKLCKLDGVPWMRNLGYRAPRCRRIIQSRRRKKMNNAITSFERTCGNN